MMVKLQELKVKLEESMALLKDNSKIEENFSRAAFLTFNSDEEANKFVNLFPNSKLGYIYALFRYLMTNIIFSWFFDEWTKKKNLKTISFFVENASEPEEILWQNLEFNVINKFLRKILIYLSFILFFGLSLAVMYGLNNAQVI